MYFDLRDFDWMQDCETFFSEALQKWSQLNCTSEFVSFEREVRTKVDTLAQLVHHKVCSPLHLESQGHFMLMPVLALYMYRNLYAFYIPF